MMQQNNYKLICLSIYLPAVPRKAFTSADCDTVYTIYLSLCPQSADASAFLAMACIYILVEIAFS